MAVEEANNYAVKHIIDHYPYIAANEVEAGRVIDQVITKKSNAEIQHFFESFFGRSKEVRDFTARFKELLETPSKDIQASLDYTKKPTPKQTPVKKAVTRRSHTEKAKQGSTTSELLLKKVEQLKQKQEKKKKRTDTFEVDPKSIRVIKDTEQKNFKKTFNEDHISGLPTNLQQFENVPMTEESIEAMSAYFTNMVTQLQVQTQPVTNQNDYVVCGCQSIKHGLYTLSPNCLRCGKIICNLEAKQTGGEYCVFCKNPLLSENQIKGYIDLLELDKLNIKKKKMEEKLKVLMVEKRKYYTDLEMDRKKGKKRQGTLTFNVQGRYQDKSLVNKQVDMILSQSSKRDQSVKELMKADEDILSLENEIESVEMDIVDRNSKYKEDQQLVDAKARLDKLLNFQNTSEERTKIIDVAGEFDFGVAGDVKDAFEGTAEERALKMKLKQRNMKLLKEQKLQKSGRGKNEVVFEVDENGNFNIKKVERDLTSTTKANEDIAIDEEDESLLQEINELREKIYNLKLKDFELSSKKVYDPSAPENKLQDVKYTDKVYNIITPDDQTGKDKKSKKPKAVPKSTAKDEKFIFDANKTSNIGMSLDSLEENIALFI